ncbi:CaiB/BaiF CoA transferase family protein [candidate division KSB1 bacterium]
MHTLFNNLVVIEAANVLAGPAVGMFFAELGALVIKIENPVTGGDTTRHWKLPEESETSDISAYFSSVNWGKKSLGVNLSSEDGRDVIYDLITRADIFIHSYKPGGERRFGLDYETLSGLNPKLIYGQITAFGAEDSRPGFDAIIQAETGFTGMNGPPGGEPTKMPVALIDVLLAHQLKEAILLALMERIQSGKGTFITVSLFQSGIASLINQAANLLVGGTIPTRSGSDHPNIAPYGTVFKTKDGNEIVIAVGTNGQFQRLCEIIGLSDLPEDGRFRTNQARVIHKNELKTLISERLLTFEREELLSALKKASIPAGAVYSLDEVFDQEAAKQMIVEGDLPEGRRITGVRSISFRSDFDNNQKPLSAPPCFNQHMNEILCGFLNYSEDHVRALQTKGAIPRSNGSEKV